MLTTTPIDTVLRGGKADHSELAKKFIRTVWEQIGITLAACYIQSHRHLILPQNMTPEKSLYRQKPAFTDEILLTLYVLEKNTTVDVQNEAVRERIFEIFMSLTESENVEIPYTRMYLPEEMAYYGWNHQRREQWDLSKVIEPDGPVTKRHSVFCEYIDRLSLWNMLQESLPILNRPAMIEKNGGRVYCGYDPERGNIAYYLILPSRRIPASDIERYKEHLVSYTLELLKSRDVWHILDEKAVEPIVCTWNELSDDQKSSLLRG